LSYAAFISQKKKERKHTKDIASKKPLSKSFLFVYYPPTKSQNLA
jgi:hypothetical protein